MMFEVGKLYRRNGELMLCIEANNDNYLITFLYKGGIILRYVGFTIDYYDEVT